MSHVPPTSLGSQLRTALLNISPRCREPRAPAPLSWTLLASARHDGSTNITPSDLQRRLYGATTAATTSEGEERVANRLVSSASTYHRSQGTKRIKRRTRRDYLTEALLQAGQRHALPVRRDGKRNLSHLNVKSTAGLKRSEENARRHAADTLPLLMQDTTLSLDRILASYISHDEARKVDREAATGIPDVLDSRETRFLSRKGYSIQDVQEWARIVTTPSPLDAAQWLHDAFSAQRGRPPPLTLPLYLLRRPYISASALRKLFLAVRQIVDASRASQNSVPLPSNATFMLFLRLIRHAREVLPASLDQVTELFLEALACIYPKGRQIRRDRIATMSYMLNKAIYIISLPAALAPYKSVDHQQVAMVRILRHMTEQDVQVPMDRQGYRGVLRIQLAQQKTQEEQQWAELKALSWPPWKQERTAMDAIITAEEHGTSRAASTLHRMREDGFALHAWEQAAQLYSGWDVDGTPTIQTRRFMGSESGHHQSEQLLWAARIRATRTAQEAWAAYLACEATKKGPDATVHFAIIEKLYAEEKRKHFGTSPQALANEGGRHRRRLLPGDTPDVFPLPPSTHLYTYTRTPVPSVEQFFRQLHNQGVQLTPATLGFVIGHATSLRLGIWYLRTRESTFSSIRSLLACDTTAIGANTTKVPSQLFSAFIKLLCRFSNVPLRNWEDDIFAFPDEASGVLQLGQTKLNVRHPLVHVMLLLGRRHCIAPEPWLNLLQALAKTETIASMRFLYATHSPTDDLDLSDVLIKGRGAVSAYSMMRRVLAKMRDAHLELGEAHIRAVCMVIENLGVACWRVSGRDPADAQVDDSLSVVARDIVRDTNRQLRGCVKNHGHLLKSHFGTLVGMEVDANVSDDTSLVFHTPSAALLHAYIRALGWMGDYGGLLELIKWMVRNHTRLAEQRRLDRNGVDLMRRALVALRVFLERSWLLDTSEKGRAEAPAGGPDVEASRSAVNMVRLATPAPERIVEEVRGLVDSVGDWGGWPSDEEVEAYCDDGKFWDTRALYSVDEGMMYRRSGSRRGV